MSILPFLNYLFGEYWLTIILSILLLVLIKIYIKKIIDSFFSFMSVFTIPGTISFVALIITAIYFIKNGYKADLIIVYLLGLIILNFHIPSTLEWFKSKLERVRIGIWEFQFAQLRGRAEALKAMTPIEEPPKIMFYNKYSYLMFLLGFIRSELENKFKSIYPEIVVPKDITALTDQVKLEPDSLEILKVKGH